MPKFDQAYGFAEMDQPYDLGSGVITPAVQKARARKNFGLAADSSPLTPRILRLNAAGRTKVGSAAGFVVAGANDLPFVTLPASQTAAVAVISLDGVPLGSTVTAVSVSGQVESAGGAVTVALDVRKVTAAAGDFTDASLGTDNVGSLVADTILSSANLAVTGLTEVLAEGEWLYLTLTATTAGSTDIVIAGVMVTYTPAAAV